jgi:hypothetical protein
MIWRSYFALVICAALCVALVPGGNRRVAAGGAPVTQFLFETSHVSLPVDASVTEYRSVMGDQNSAEASDIYTVAYVVPTSGTFSDILIKLDGDYGGNNDDLTFALMREPDGAGWDATGVYCFLAGTGGPQTECDTSTGSQSYNAGDLIAMRIETGSSSTSGFFPPGWVVKWVSDNDDESIIMGSTVFDVNGDSHGPPFARSGDSGDASITYAQVPIMGDGTTMQICNLHVDIGVDHPLTSGTADFTINVDGTPSSVTCEIDSAGSGDDDYSCEDTSNCVTVSEGDMVTLERTVSGTTPLSNIAAWGATFESTDQEWLSCHGANSINDGTNYWHLSGRAGNGSESINDTWSGGTSFTIVEFGLWVEVAPGSGESRTMTWRENGSNQTSCQVVLSDTETWDTDACAETVSTDVEITWAMSNSASPAGSQSTSNCFAATTP